MPDPMDFSAWFQVYLSGHWFTFDARHNVPRIGRILMATGRDATDVALSTTFGSSRLARFEVITEEVTALNEIAMSASGIRSPCQHPAGPPLRCFTEVL